MINLRSEPRPVVVIEEQLADLAEIIAMKDDMPEGLASEIVIDSWKRREAELLEELEAAKWLEKLM
jgi:hypothetical protein